MIFEIVLDIAYVIFTFTGAIFWAIRIYDKFLKREIYEIY